MQLRQYQEHAVVEVARKLASGKRKVIFQLATGGGKTVVFSAIAQRYIAKTDKSILILIHRKELLAQTRRTLHKLYNINAQAIKAGMKYIPPADVYVGMVESVNRRIAQLSNIGIVIIDEAHITSFNKLHEHFPEQYIIGFSATPLSANKKRPLKLFYDDIVCGVDIPDLISDGHLCQNITRAPKDVVDRHELMIKNGEFEEHLMGLTFSKPKYIHNTITAYERWSKGLKTIIFNCNMEHSRNVCQAFNDAGYKAQYLDSEMNNEDRDTVLEWFKQTPDAILCNVAIATTGFDEPTIETVIVNKATMSMPLWLQITGRGSRPTPVKSAFNIIDMGGNALTHGDWCQSRDWKDLFFNPPKVNKKDGVTPVKDCPQCCAIIAAGISICPYCGFVFPTKNPLPEEQLGEFIVITENINIDQIIQQHANKKEYYPFFRIGEDLARKAKSTIPIMSQDLANFILQKYYDLAKEWTRKISQQRQSWNEQIEQFRAMINCQDNDFIEIKNGWLYINGGQDGCVDYPAFNNQGELKRKSRINFNAWHKEKAQEHLFTELQKYFPTWKPEKLVSTQV